MSTSAYDKMYEAVEGFPLQAKRCNLATAVSGERVAGSYSRIVCCGMGGSAFPMEIVRGLVDVPVSIHRDYSDTLDQRVDGTLYILLSFSGNTEEVLDCARRLIELDASMVVVTNGGRLAELSREFNLCRLGFPALPPDFQPRCATGYFLALTLGLTDSLGLSQARLPELLMICDSLYRERDNVLRDAQRLQSVIDLEELVLLAYPPYSVSVGQIGRIKLNENAKRLLHVGTLPEFNHNQMEAACSGSRELGIVLLTSSADHVRKRKRVDHRKGVSVARFDYVKA